MEITKIGHSSFKIKTKKIILVTDPFNPEMVGKKFPKTKAEIVTISHNHKDHNYTNGLEGIRKIIDGPGEYEVSGVSILGYASFHDDKKGEERGKNVIYKIESEDIKIVHLGDLGHDLSDKECQCLGEVDVLMIPVGGFYTIGPKEAVEILKKLNPSITIPMHYNQSGLDENFFGKLFGVDDFLKESQRIVERVDKLKIDSTDLIDIEKVVVFE